MKALASLTPEESKALIAKALWTLPEMKEAVRSGTVVIAADSTSVHVVREFCEGKAPEDPGPSSDVDGLLGRTDHFDAVFCQHALVIQIERAVERGLPAHGRQ